MTIQGQARLFQLPRYCAHRMARLVYDVELSRWAGPCPDCEALIVITDEQIIRDEAAPKLEDVAVQMLGLNRHVEPYRADLVQGKPRRSTLPTT